MENVNEIKRIEEYMQNKEREEGEGSIDLFLEYIDDDKFAKFVREKLGKEVDEGADGYEIYESFYGDDDEFPDKEDEFTHALAAYMVENDYDPEFQGRVRANYNYLCEEKTDTAELENSEAFKETLKFLTSLTTEDKVIVKTYLLARGFAEKGVLGGSKEDCFHETAVMRTHFEVKGFDYLKTHLVLELEDAEVLEDAEPAQEPPKSVSLATPEIVDLFGLVQLKKNFWVGAAPVTEKEFERLMGYVNNSVGPDYPVTNISAFEAMQYCNELSKRFFLTPVYNEKDWTIENECGGFKLPDFKEAEFIVQSAGSWKGTFDDQATEKYAVAQNKRSDNGLFDIVGNVYQWSDSLESRGKSYVYGSPYMYKDEFSEAAFPENTKRDFLGFRVILKKGE